MDRRESFDCLVIGAGPAGILAAGTAAGRGLKTALLEKNDVVGRKLLLAGGGRCNISNALPLKDFLQAFGPGGPFLRSAMTAFGPEQTEAFLAQRGISLYREGTRLFVTGGAEALVQVLTRFLQDHRVRIFFNQHVQQVLPHRAGGFEIITRTGRFFATGKVIITTGGCSYPSTGSSGDGFALARELGHEIVPPVPAMGPVRLADGLFTGLSGVSVSEVAFEVLSNERRAGTFTGDLLITHDGISGPAVLDGSLPLARALQKGSSVRLKIDFLPAIGEDELLTRLKDAAGYADVLERLPRRLRKRLMERAGIEATSVAVTLTRTQRHRLRQTLKSLTLPVADTGTFRSAMVTVGGVSLKQVDPKTMQSRVVKGIYFAGEVLDVAGACGGFNIQSALSTGHLAGISSS